MNNQCPRCSGSATITHGRFRDLTHARFDTEYTDGVLGMAGGVKTICPTCGEINLPKRDYHSLVSNKIDAKEIDKFKAAFPHFRGVIPLSSWLNPINDKGTD